jgi:hypothetical protein
MFFRRSWDEARRRLSEDPGHSERDRGAAGMERALAVELEGREVAVLLRRHARARRISLRIDSRRDAAVLTLPPRVREADALAFLRQHGTWVVDQLDALPERIPFADGAAIPFLGRERLIAHDAAARGAARLDAQDDGILRVAGAIEHLPRRVTDFMKREARAAIRPLVTEKAARLGVEAGRIILRDQRTRWGSCTATGDLNFSWRLIYCPPAILDYVVAHEVAHLRHMDHSPAFWATVEEIAPMPKRSRAWLRQHGHRLHRIG